MRVYVMRRASTAPTPGWLPLGLMTGEHLYERYDYRRFAAALGDEVWWRPGGGFYADDAPGGWWWLSSFGAGFSCHGALLEVA